MSSDVQVRRKVVNRIEDSDSDAGTPVKSRESESDSDDSRDKEKKQQYLINLYPEYDIAVNNLIIFNNYLYYF